MAIKVYIFKKVGLKHSVRLILHHKGNNIWIMENKSYKGLFYRVENPKEELEEIDE